VTRLEIVGEAPPAVVVGDQAPGFEGLLGVDGQRYGLSTFADNPVLVLIFASNRCPTVKAYESRLRRLVEDYEGSGVQLVGINSNDPHLYPEESYERMVEFARESGYGFPYLLDEEQRTARAYGVTRTFHLFVLDSDRRVRYQGRFDDSRLPARVTTHDLRNALDDVIADRPVRVPVTRPFGCSLDYIGAAAGSEAAPR
jgi:peroxiredoxin